MSHDVDTWEKVLSHLAGVAGALVSMRFVSGTVPERLTMAFGGAAFSYYAAPWASTWLSLPEGLLGFLLGLFGMSVLAKIWDWLSTTSIVGDFLDAWLNRRKPPQ